MGLQAASSLKGRIGERVGDSNFDIAGGGSFKIFRPERKKGHDGLALPEKRKEGDQIFCTREEWSTSFHSGEEGETFWRVYWGRG